MKKMLFVYNPKAGKAQIRMKLSDIIQIFSGAGYEVTIFPTKASGDARKIVEKKAEKYDLLVCSGGDGTLDEVVTGVMKLDRRIPIGYIPAGSTNDFANSLHIPKNMLQAAKDIVSGQYYACDAGTFNTDNFIYIAAFGLFTDVSYETNQEMKNVLGHMAYILEGVKRLSTVKSYHVKVTCGERTIEDDFMFGMVTNSLSVGGFKRITGKYVELNDGEFEVTLIKKPKNPLELNQIMAALLNRDIDTDSMYCFKASCIHFESKENLAWTLDGEFGGEHKEVLIENREKALDFMVKTREK